MRRPLLVFVVVSALTFAVSMTASADPDDIQPGGTTDSGLLALITDDDVFSTADLSLLLATPATPLAPAGTPTQHYGPYASDSPDSGTCGNDWAQDTFDRHFTVRANQDGTFTVVEQFKGGSFETDPGLSPGACQTDDGSNTTSVPDDIEGSMHGYLIATVTGTQTTTSSDCFVAPQTECTTTGFLLSHFAGTFDISTFFFHYSAGDQGLIEHEWKNASCDRGGNHGDIATAEVRLTAFQIPLCP